MRPHPEFKGWQIPRLKTLGDIQLKALTIKDVERDYRAIIESSVEIKAANPSSRWPDGLTLEKNLIDLAWHQREFEAKRSFAWVMEDDEGIYLGCLYVYPSITGDRSAEVNWWWRTGYALDEDIFREHLLDWLASTEWPDLNFKLRTS